MRVLAWALVLVSMVALSPRAARAVSTSRLARIFRALSDSDQRVRIQALVALAKLKDRRAVPRLITVLRKDRSSIARALAAAALGTIGDVRAAPALRAKLADRSRRVRGQARIALARLMITPTPSGRALTKYVHIPKRKRPPGPRVLVTLGSMGAKTAKGRRHRKLLHRLWRDKVASTTEVGLLEAGEPVPKGQQKVYGVSSSITKLKRVRTGRLVKTTCMVSVMVDQGGSIVMMTTGGATVEVSTRRFSRRDAQQSEQSALENAIASAHQNLMRYLSRQ
ncbi:MAG: HEAT repeat domain-containing protein [Deltaproteobacteria bacterium]|nr:HEAT repeat domain-containing protein [Deltaproteobacteria bacterium]